VAVVSRDRIAAAIVVACALSLVLAMRVSVGFEASRTKVVDGGAVDPVGVTVAIDVDPRTVSGPPSPTAVIARIENASPNTQRLRILMDGQIVCARSVGSHTNARVDCAWQGSWFTDRPHRIEVAGSDTMWRLTYLELATHHGATRGHDLVVLPDAYGRRVGPGWPEVAVFFLLMAGLMLAPLPEMRRGLVLAYRAALGGVAVLFVLLMVSPHLSSFLVVISFGLFWKCVAVVAAPRLWQVVVWSRYDRPRAWRVAIAGGAAAVLVVISYGPLVYKLLKDDYRGNYSGFLRMSVDRFDAHPTLSVRKDVRASLILSDSTGYDGQFVYYSVYDPLLQEFRGTPATYGQFIDAPTYRYGRIGFSLLTRLIAGNRWQDYPQTMIWLVLGGIAACFIGLISLSAASDRSAMWAGVVVLIPGFWQSVQVGLPEPIAAALLVGGYACLTRGRHFWTGVLFACSLLVRETGAIFIACLIGAQLLAGHRRTALTLAGFTFAPLLLWRGFVGWVLSPAAGAAAFWHSTGDFGVPLGGLVELWTRIGDGQYFGGMGAFATAGIWFPSLLIAGFAIAVWMTVRRPGPVAAAAALYGLMAISLTYDKIWEHIGNGQRGTFELFLMIAIVSLTETARLSRGLRIALAAFWSATAGYVFIGAFDARYIRDAIGALLF
jgi:hypothetical protein